MKKYISLLFLSQISFYSFAEGWTGTFGLQDVKSSTSMRANSSENTVSNAFTSLVKKVNSQTYVGGSFGYSSSKSHFSQDNAHADATVNSFTLFTMHDIGSSRFLDFSIGRGSTDVDGHNLNANRFTNYSADAKFINISVGVSQIVPLSSNLNSIFSFRISNFKNTTSSFTNNLGEYNKEVDSTNTVSSLGTGLLWDLGLWSPSVRLNYVHSNRELIFGSSDKDYYRYSIGLGYRYAPDIKFNFGYGGVFDKEFSNENLFQLSVSKLF